MKTLVTISLKPTQFISITEESNGTMYIFICGKKFLVQKANSSTKTASKFIATRNFENINDFILFANKLNENGVDFFKAHY